MIRKLGAIVMVLALALSMGVMPVVADDPVCPDVPDDADEVALLAGQDLNVGSVFVWNDAVNLCVKYELSGDALNDGWLIYETHLAVADDRDDIPTNRSGNPVPGHFPYGDDELDGVEEWCVCIPLAELGVEPGVELFVAAHAVVMREGEELVANGGFESPIVDGSWQVFPEDTGGLEWKVKPAEGDDWGVDYDKQGLELQTYRLWTPYEGDQYAELAAWVPVKISQDLEACPSGLYTLRYAWSPRPGVAVNEMNVWWDGEDLAFHEASGADNTDTVWTLETHALLTGPSSGTVGVAFAETQDGQDTLGMFLDGVSVVCIEKETAWADGTRFVQRGNWATWFTYTVEEFSPDWLDGLVLWLDANAIEDLDDGEAVAQWDDLSGNYNHAGQTDEARQPTYVVSGLDGMPVVQFDGIDDWMYASLDSIEFAATTLFAVTRVNSLAASSPDTGGRVYIVAFAVSGSGWHTTEFKSTNGNWRGRTWDGTGKWVQGSAVVDNDWKLLSLTSENDDVIDFWEEGDWKGSTPVGTMLTGQDILAIGANGVPSGFLNGDIAEILIYDQALSDGEREAVEQYLSSKWGL